MTKMTLLLIQ